MSGDFRLKPALKDPDEAVQVALKFYKYCARTWQPNELYTAGEFVRPSVGNGFSYEADAGGTSSQTEPPWKINIGDAVPDGSVSWICRAAGSNAINPLTSPSATVDISGLNVIDVSASEDWKILSTYSGGTTGRDYEVKYAFTLNGVTRIARQIVKVRKR